MRGVIVDGPSARLDLAGLSLLERMAVALRRAGAVEITIVGKEPLPRFRRLGAMGIAVTRAEGAPAHGDRIIADGALLADAADARRVAEARGRLHGAGGSPLPLRYEPGDGSTGDERRALPALGPALLVTDEPSRARAESLLWESLGSPGDGVMDRWFNRPLGRLLSRLLVRTPVSPNQVTVLGALVGLAGAALIAGGARSSALAGALLFQLSAAIDCVDGEIARILFKESRLGKWLDLALDNLVHLSVFAALTSHCLASEVPGPVLAFGISTIVGSLISIAVTLRAMRLPLDRRDPRLSALMDRITNRDFSVCIIFFLLIGRPEWFLWLSGILAHAFWIGALFAQAPGLVPTARARR